MKLFTLIGDDWLHKLAEYDVTAAAGLLLNAIKYCTKMRKTGPVGQTVE